MASFDSISSNIDEHIASTESLLEKNKIDEIVVANDKSLFRKSPKRWSHREVLVFHFVLITIYTIVFFALVLIHFHSPQTCQEQGLIYSPAREALVKERKTLDAAVLHQNVFKGLPRPELDKAWQELLAPANIRVSAEILAKANKTSIALEDGSGYYAILDVYHQLHCLKYIRHYVHKEYYQDTKPWTSTHVDHCIDSIRQNLMCNADISLMTFRWVDDSLDPKPNFVGEHTCVNWEKINSWVKERSFDVDDPKLLKHP